MYSAEILADSVSPSGIRITSIAVTFPRIILAEQNTHRVFSRNTASSRAIPVKTRCDMIEQNPFIPEVFGKNQKGMQAEQLLDAEANEEAAKIWREALQDALKHARRLSDIGVHKQYANRLTEPFAWVTQLVTSTEWDNYFALRCHPAAQPEIQVAANHMRDVIQKARGEKAPKKLKIGEWHLPFADGNTSEEYIKVSVARSAAISYEKHNVAKTLEEEAKKHDAMLSLGHMSPFEHQAKVGTEEEILKYGRFFWQEGLGGGCFVADTIGNFRTPWIQYRKMLPNEEVFKG